MKALLIVLLMVSLPAMADVQCKKLARIDALTAERRWIPTEEQEPPRDPEIDLLAVVLCTNGKTIRRATVMWEPVHGCWALSDGWPQEGMKVLKWMRLPPETEDTGQTPTRYACSPSK